MLESFAAATETSGELSQQSRSMFSQLAHRKSSIAATKTARCPHFTKAREEHPDSKPGGKRSLVSHSGPPETLRRASVIRQPGDGSCLFHSLAFGLKDGSSADL